MKIDKIEFKNFRLLENENATLSLDEYTTIIVGKNNCGKTSLTEMFHKCLERNGETFVFEDFALNTHEKFKNALFLYKQYKEVDTTEDEIKEEKWNNFIKEVPKIQLTVHIKHEPGENISVLKPFMVDLDDECDEVVIIFRYMCVNPEKMYNEITEEIEKLKEATGDKDLSIDVIEYIRINLKKYYKFKIVASNLNKDNYLNVNMEDIKNVFETKFVYAQRDVDDVSDSKSKNLSKLCETFFKIRTEEDNSLTQKINIAIEDTTTTWDEKYIEIFSDFFDDLKLFGYPTINSYEMILKSHFEAKKLLSGNTTVYYQQDDKSSLPESYNGLGYSNLIYIMLQLATFSAEFDKGNARFMLLFIEEPEAHLHPQMQYTFIKNITDYIRDKQWPVQIIITTHSAHIIAESEFTAIRYFNSSNGYVKVRDLLEFSTSKGENEAISFLKQYIVLNYCEMFFADKVIMIEGTVERLLIPHMIRKCDKKNSTSLMNEYISIIEVGGAYAHLFKELVEFIDVKTLIITDIDAIDTANKRRACKVCEGNESSNQTLCKWLPAKKELQELLRCTDDEKVQGTIKVTYQIPEEDNQSCGRSFEEAFILKNPSIFINYKDKIQSLKRILEVYNTEDEIIEKSYDIAGSVSKKTDFAFDMIAIGTDKWEIPKYIMEGLVWLA